MGFVGEFVPSHRKNSFFLTFLGILVYECILKGKKERPL